MGCIHGKGQVIVKSSIKCSNSPDVIEAEKKNNKPKTNESKTNNSSGEQHIKPHSSKKNPTNFQIDESNSDEIQKSKDAMNKLKKISHDEVVKSRKFF